MQRKLKIGIIALALASLLAGVVIAELLITKEITTTIMIKPMVSMGVFEADGETPLETIAFGQLTQLDTAYFPGHTTTKPTQYYFINNTDQQSFYIAFDMVDYPLGLLFYVSIKRGDKETWVELDTGVHPSNIYEFPIESPLVNPDPATQYAEFYIKVRTGTPEFGTYNPLFLIHAYDTASG